MTGPVLRSALKQLVKGGAVPRPLFIPLLFAVAAKVEGTPLPRFLTNPTQLANTLRRVQGFLRLDGVTCYFDSLLEAEALGCRLDWDSYPPDVVERPALLGVDPQETAEGIEARGRIPVALEVVRRLRIMLGEAMPLVVGVTGPLALARQLAPGAGVGGWADLLAFTGSVFLRVAREFCEAGADIIIVEEELPEPSSALYGRWADYVASAGKVIRFYEALPVMLIRRDLKADELDALLSLDEALVICPTVGSLPDGARSWLTTSRTCGVALPPALLEEPSVLRAHVEQCSLPAIAAAGQLALLTTAGEIPYGWDVKRLPALLAAARSAVR